VKEATAGRWDENGMKPRWLPDGKQSPSGRLGAWEYGEMVDSTLGTFFERTISLFSLDEKSPGRPKLRSITLFFVRIPLRRKTLAWIVSVKLR